jgi:hypothetical protein
VGRGRSDPAAHYLGDLCHRKVDDVAEHHCDPLAFGQLDEHGDQLPSILTTLGPVLDTREQIDRIGNVARG